jgi:Domain of unknown function (DUF4440)
MRLILLCAFLLIAGAAAAHPNAPLLDDASLRRELTTARDAIQQAVKARDAIKLKALYADGFTHTHGSGKIDGKDQRIVSLLTDEPAIEMARLDEFSVRSYFNQTAIVQGKSPILNLKENKYYDFRWMAIYVRDGREWKLAASQATRLPDPPRDQP